MFFNKIFSKYMKSIFVFNFFKFPIQELYDKKCKGEQVSTPRFVQIVKCGFRRITEKNRATEKTEINKETYD